MKLKISYYLGSVSVQCDGRETRGKTYADAGAEHKEGQNELGQHANNDSVPDDLLAIAGSQPEAEKDDNEAEAGNSTVGTSVIRIIWLDEGAETNDSDCAKATKWEPKSLWDENEGAADNVFPKELERHHEVAGWDIKSDLRALLAWCVAHERWEKLTRRTMTASHRRNGTTQPKSPLWRIRPAIHHLRSN